MKNKFFWLVALLTFCNSAFAVDSVIEYRVSPKRSAIQSTNMVFSNVQVKSSGYIYDQISELERKASEQPENLYGQVLLAKAYVRSKNYISSFDIFEFLLEKKEENSLSPDVIVELKKIKQILGFASRQPKNLTDVYSNLILVNSLLDNEVEANRIIEVSCRNITNSDLFIRSFVYVHKPFDEDTTKFVNRLLKLEPESLVLKRIKASCYFSQDKIELAEKELQEILELDMNDFSVREDLYYNLKDNNLSEKELLKRLYPSSSVSQEEIYLDFARLLDSIGETQQAKEYIKKLINDYPENGEGYLLLAELLVNESNLKEAYQILLSSRDKLTTNEMISKYNELLAKLSDEPVKEADSLMNNGLYSEALNVLSSASQEDLYVILGLARANYFLGNKQVAYESLNKAMSLYPNNEDVFYYFSYILYKDGDLESSRNYLNKTLGVNPNHKFALQLQDVLNKADADKYFNQIISAFEVQNYQEAMRLINEALSINKKDSALYYYQGLTYIAMNNYAAATAPLYKALELDKNNVIAYFYLGLAFDNLSEQNNALSNYKEFIRQLHSDNYGEADKLNYAKLRVEKLSK